jgi:hypothetical protein
MERELPNRQTTSNGRKNFKGFMADDSGGFEEQNLYT